MALTTDVHPGDIVASPWGNEIRNRTMQVFASTAERDAQWVNPPNGAFCVVASGTDGTLYQRRAGAWSAVHVQGLLSETDVTVKNGNVVVQNGQVTSSLAMIAQTSVQATTFIQAGTQFTINKNVSSRTWDTAQMLAQGDLTNGARVSMFNPGTGGLQIGAFGSATGLYLLNHGGTTLGTLNYTATSEARFKRELEAWRVDLDKLMGLVVRQFRRPVEPPPDAPDDYQEELGPLELGLVVEEVDPVAPELVVDHDAAGYRAVNAPELTFWLLSAVQELARRVAALEAAVT
jgi:hypothetical protein